MIEILGWITAVVLIGGGVMILLYWAGNLYGNIKGSLRWREVRDRSGVWTESWWVAFKGGIDFGSYRYDKKRKIGSYYRLGGVRVPVDGRDPLDKDRYWR